MKLLEGYGIHTLIWDAADDRLGDFLVASPADAEGRGLELHVRQGGRAADVTGADVYFIWRHKRTGRRGCEPMEEIDASLGQFLVYYPAAMQEEEGAVDAQCMVSWDDKSISTRAFTIRVEPVIIGGTESEDGFTLFVETIKRYEGAIEVTTDAADAANEAARLADVARNNLLQAAQSGAFDGSDGIDGFSPSASVAQTAGGALITITDRDGTTTAVLAHGAKGDKGDVGEAGPQGPKGDTGDRGPQGIQGETGPRGEKGETGATGARGPKGEDGDAGATGPQGPRGDKGDAGADGDDGMSCTHSWDGTVLTVTSASGTSSADLVGPQGPTGATGPAGPAGADGTTFTPVSPLSLSNGELSVDLSGYQTATTRLGRLIALNQAPNAAEDISSAAGVVLTDVQVGDFIWDRSTDRLTRVKTIASARTTIEGILELQKFRTLIPTTTLDVAEGQTGSGTVDVDKHPVRAGTLILNTTSGNLMTVTTNVSKPWSGSAATVSVLGLGCVFGGSASYTASSPLSIDSSNDISIDLSSYATTQYVDDAIAALDDLSEVGF